MELLPIEYFYKFFAVLIRVGCIFAFLPFINEETIPKRIRIGFVLLLSLILFPVVNFSIKGFPVNMSGLVISMIPEVMLGVCIGLVGRLILGAVQIAGQIAGEMMGFGMANTLDPLEQSQVSVIGELQYMMAIVVFLILDVHHIFIAAMVKSFSVVPPFSITMRAELLDFLIKAGGEMFIISLQLAAPITAAMLFVNFAMAAINKVVPTLNVFMESFPLRIIVGIIVIVGSMGLLVALISEIYGTIPEKLDKILQLV